MFAAIDSAQDYLLVEFYILRDDGLGHALRDRLVAKLSEGIRVYVLYDRIGSQSLTRRYLTSLKDAGAEVAPFVSTRSPMRRLQVKLPQPPQDTGRGRPYRLRRRSQRGQRVLGSRSRAQPLARYPCRGLRTGCNGWRSIGSTTWAPLGMLGLVTKLPRLCKTTGRLPDRCTVNRLGLKTNSAG